MKKNIEKHTEQNEENYKLVVAKEPMYIGREDSPATKYIQIITKRNNS